MTAAALACSCASPTHEGPRCPQRAVLLVRASVYAGLYDAGETVNESVRLLAPGYAGDDPAARRFALIEID